MTRYSNQVIPVQINPRDIVTVIPQVQGINLVDNPLLVEYVPIALTTYLGFVDTSTNTLIGNIIIAGGSNHAVAVSPSGKNIYVSNTSTGVILMYQTSSGTLINSIQGGLGTADPMVFSSDGSLLYAANSTSNTISVINTALQKVTNTIGAGLGADGVCLLSNNSILYSSASTDNLINSYDALINPYKFLKSVSVTTGKAIVSGQNNSVLYVISTGAVAVKCISVNSLTVIDTITLPDIGTSLAITPDQQYLYVAGGSGTTNLYVISTATNDLYATITVGNTPQSVTISPDGLRCYVTCSGTNNLYIVNTVTNTVVTNIAFTSPDVVKTFPLPTFLIGQGRLIIMVNEQLGTTKNFQFEVVGGYDSVLGLRNYNYIDGTNVNCSIVTSVTNNIQLTTTYGSTFNFVFSGYPTIQPTIHRVIRGGAVTSTAVTITVRDYVPNIVW